MKVELELGDTIIISGSEFVVVEITTVTNPQREVTRMGEVARWAATKVEAVQVHLAPKVDL